MKFKTIVLFGAGIGSIVATHVRAKKAGSGGVIHPGSQCKRVAV